MENAQKKGGKESREVPVNPSSWQFGCAPDNSMLRPRGHGRIDNSVRMVRRTKRFVELISSYGTLRISPLEDAVIRQAGNTVLLAALCASNLLPFGVDVFEKALQLFLPEKIKAANLKALEFGQDYIANA